MTTIATDAAREYAQFSAELARTMPILGVGVRGVAEETGVSPATVCRATQGKEIYASHYLALQRWMGLARPGVLALNMLREWDETPECDPITIYIDNVAYQVRKPWLCGAGAIPCLAGRPVGQLVCREIDGRLCADGHVIDGDLVDVGVTERVAVKEGDRFVLLPLDPVGLGWAGKV